MDNGCQWREIDGGVKCWRCRTVRPFPIRRRCQPSQAPSPIPAYYHRAAAESLPPRESDVVADCPHLGAPFANEAGDGAAEVMVPCGCGGNVNKERPATVFECLLFRDADGDPGECLPYWRPNDRQRQKYESRADAIRLCDGCGRGAE